MPYAASFWLLLFTCGFSEFRLSYYPHRLEVFKDMLKDAFGRNADHKIYGDFKTLEEVETPNFYIHHIEKPGRNY